MLNVAEMNFCIFDIKRIKRTWGKSRKLGRPTQHFLLFSTSLINTLPHNKILDWSKLKAFADDKLNATEKLKFVLGRVENIVGKGENAGHQHFLLFPQCFQKPSLSGSLKVGIVW